LGLLHDLESRFGRTRDERWESRIIDLDLLAYDDVVSGADEAPRTPVLPHPEMHRRAFVLLPLAEVAPAWRHPRLGRTVTELIRDLPPGQRVEALDEASIVASG
jgi:2-amino-4-hydroxy-6-hydroxymethyldihydropteridine diphosphokinase